MPYRRLPNTDASRLKALKTVLYNDEIYTVRNRFIDWTTLSKARTVYDKLLTAADQYRIAYSAQLRGVGKGDKLQRNAMMYVSHFLQVLVMSVDRGEIKRSALRLYGLPEDNPSLPNIRTASGLLKYGTKAVEGEKERLKNGGRPIYNPTAGMVSTHLDIFRECYEGQEKLRARTNQALEILKTIRPETDAVLLELWNQIEDNFKEDPPDVRYAECRKYGVVYYYRRNEDHKY